MSNTLTSWFEEPKWYLMFYSVSKAQPFYSGMKIFPKIHHTTHPAWASSA